MVLLYKRRVTILSTIMMVVFAVVVVVVTVVTAVHGLSSISVGGRRRHAGGCNSNSWSRSSSSSSRRSSEQANHQATTIAMTTTTTPSTTTTSTSNSNVDDDDIVVVVVSLNELLSTCMDACHRGCLEIQAVQRKRQAGESFAVSFKDAHDPKSALTEADQRAQDAIVQALRLEWGPDLHIVSEEDDEDENENENEENVMAVSSIRSPFLQRNLCRHIVQQSSNVDTTTDALPERLSLSPLSTTTTTLLEDKKENETKDVMVDLNHVTIFVDPVDGTREFVEGRLRNCQCLVGIAVNGIAMAGAIGLPFPTGRLEDNDSNNSHNNSDSDSSNSDNDGTASTTTPTTIVYGQVGAGYGVHGGPLPTSMDYLKSHPHESMDESDAPILFARPILASGDANVPLMVHTRQQLVDIFGGSNALLGGAGTKILATALGHVDCTVQHQFGGPWDTCAPQAILHAMGGQLTDWNGNALAVYGDGGQRQDDPSSSSSSSSSTSNKNSTKNNANLLGFVATTGHPHHRPGGMTMTTITKDPTTTPTTTQTHPTLTHDTLIGMLRMSPPI